MNQPGRSPERGVAALVLIRPAPGQDPDRAGAITTATIGRHAPEPAEAEAVRRFFAEQGFETGPLVGIAFDISADRDLMERWFPGVDRLVGSGEELPLGELPQEVRNRIAAVTTESPPELHP